MEEVPPPIGYDDESTQTDEATSCNLELDANVRKLSLDCSESSVVIPDGLVPEMIERLRVSTDLSHENCKKAIQILVSCLGENVPGWLRRCNQISQKLSEVDLNMTTPEVLLQSSDAINMKAIFQKLWFCKNDEQQRSWPVHEDEKSIQSHLAELTKLLANANPNITRDIIAKNNYDNVHMLVTYFQMETRRSLRMELYAVLVEIIRLSEAVIPDYLLSSVLPGALADEMLNYKQDTERWTSASFIFTIIFCTGHKPPINIYDHVNEQFVIQLLDIIEGEDADGTKLELDIALESSIPALLAFNLQFAQMDTNLVLKALHTRTNARRLTENLVSYLNWEEDPTRVAKVLPEPEFRRQNAVHKLLIEMFNDTSTAKLFYYNDVRVVIDINITHLNNLLAEDKVMPVSCSLFVLALLALLPHTFWPG